MSPHIYIIYIYIYIYACNNRNHLKRALSKSRPQSSRFEIPASRHPGYLFSLVYQTSCTSFADREICKIDKLSTFPHFLLSSRINPSSRQGPPAPHSPTQSSYRPHIVPLPSMDKHGSQLIKQHQQSLHHHLWHCKR